ncbi:hypothetical protein [Alteribacter populi]|uniref:hypothetical protein n=1 Tax=Alteribacter populi TaxID=2011011 RepID=UPI0012FF60B1|nr:hypothetical protein [Alteribacter populi]
MTKEIPKRTQQGIVDFFMRTSVPRILAEEAEKEKQAHKAVPPKKVKRKSVKEQAI